MAPYRIASPPAGFGFYGHPDWLLIGRDDSLIAKYGLTTAGFGHTTEKVIRGNNDGLPIEAFIHRWHTQRTESYTDSDGRPRTRTVTENHSEIASAVTMPFSFPLLSVGGGWAGKKLRFESEEFNKRFTVRTDNPKLASDVIHPRAMEYLMTVQPPGFRIEGGLMCFSVDKHDTQLIGFVPTSRTSSSAACRRSSGRTCRSLRRCFAGCPQTESPGNRHSRAVSQMEV